MIFRWCLLEYEAMIVLAYFFPPHCPLLCSTKHPSHICQDALFVSVSEGPQSIAINAHTCMHNSSFIRLHIIRFALSRYVFLLSLLPFLYPLLHGFLHFLIHLHSFSMLVYFVLSISLRVSLPTLSQCLSISLSFNPLFLSLYLSIDHLWSLILSSFLSLPHTSILCMMYTQAYSHNHTCTAIHWHLVDACPAYLTPCPVWEQSQCTGAKCTPPQTEAMSLTAPGTSQNVTGIVFTENSLIEIRCASDWIHQSSDSCITVLI